MAQLLTKVNDVNMFTRFGECPNLITYLTIVVESQTGSLLRELRVLSDFIFFTERIDNILVVLFWYDYLSWVQFSSLLLFDNPFLLKEPFWL